MRHHTCRVDNPDPPELPILSYLIVFIIGMVVGLLVAALIFNAMPDYPFIHGPIA